MEILILSLLALCFLALSGVFSGAETGILSCSILKVKNLSSRNDYHCKVLEGLLDKKQQIVILLLIGTNAANTLFSLAGENLLLRIWNILHFNGPPRPPGFLFTAALLTPLLVILGEIFPKSLYRHYSFSLTRLSAPFIHFLKNILLPVTLPFRLLTFKSFSYSLTASSYNRRTINLLAESGIELGNIYLQQEILIRHFLNLSNITLDSLMEPLQKRDLLTAEMDRKRVIKSINRKVQDPCFVLRGKKIIGTVSLFDIWKMPHRAPVKNYITPITYLSPRHTAMHALEYLLTAKKQLVIIGNDNSAEGFVSIGKLLGKGLRLQ